MQPICKVIHKVIRKVIKKVKNQTKKSSKNLKIKKNPQNRKNYQGKIRRLFLRRYQSFSYCNTVKSRLSE